MVGAGVFTAFGPAAKFAGNQLLFAILLAGAIALLNARSMAQLAAAIPKSGGAYVYASQVLSPTWGFTAGIAFLVGKIGSVAAISLTISNYLGQPSWAAVLALWLMFGINAMGVNRTALGARILSLITLTFLFSIAAVSFTMPDSANPLPTTEPLGLLTATGFLFFAFAGYARVATLGGEVIRPERNVPIAIGISLGLVLALYFALGWQLQRVLGQAVALSERAIFDLSKLALDPIGDVVVVIAVIASLGSLLALLAGMGRLGASMARDDELPSLLAMQNSKSAPWVAELTIVILATGLILTDSVYLTIGLSSFAVLVYYAIANLAALRQARSIWQKLLALAGLATGLLVAIAVPPNALALGAALLTAALLVRSVLAKRRSID